MKHDRSLLSDIQTFLNRYGMAESTFGRAAVNDWKLVSSLRSGRRVWPETEAKIRQFMQQYRRKQGTVRPQRSVAEAAR